MNANERFVFFTSKNFPQKSTRFRYMTPIYPAQSWKVTRTNKPHKRKRKNILIPLISLHIKKKHLYPAKRVSLRGKTTPPHYSNLPRNHVAYIFSALSLVTVSMQFLAHLRLNDPYSTSLTSTRDLYRLNTILVRLYNAAGSPASHLRSDGSLAITRKD